jgi:hypothetical protein
MRRIAITFWWPHRHVAAINNALNFNFVQQYSFTSKSIYNIESNLEGEDDTYFKAENIFKKIYLYLSPFKSIRDLNPRCFRLKTYFFFY